MTDRKLQLQLSRDGGHTYPYRQERDMGEPGEYERRIRFQRLGICRRAVMKLRTTSPVRVDIYGLIARYTVSDN